MHTFNRLIFSLSTLLLAAPAQAADLTLTALPADSRITLNWGAVPGAKAYSLCAALEPITDIDRCTAYQGGTWLDLTGRSFTLNEPGQRYRLFLPAGGLQHPQNLISLCFYGVGINV